MLVIKVKDVLTVYLLESIGGVHPFSVRVSLEAVFVTSGFSVGHIISIAK